MDNVDASPEKIDFFVYNIMEWGKKNKRHFVWRYNHETLLCLLSRVRRESGSRSWMCGMLFLRMGVV